MPRHQGPQPSQEFANTNGTLRKEIKNNLLGQINNIGDLKRVSNSIAESGSFHLDAQLVTDQQYPGYYKVDVQYKQGSGKLSGKTVAIIMLDPNAEDLDCAKEAICESAEDGHIWIVT